MSLTPVTRTIAGVEKEAYVVTGTEATEEVILRESLMEIDEKYLTLVDQAEGDDLKEKLIATVLPIGINAYTFFKERISLTDDLVALGKRTVVRRDVVGAIVNLQDTTVQLEHALL